MLKLPNVANLDSYMSLCGDDAEQDFFNNIVHLQVKLHLVFQERHSADKKEHFM